MEPTGVAKCECCSGPGIDFNEDVVWLCAECLLDELTKTEIDQWWEQQGDDSDA